MMHERIAVDVFKAAGVHFLKTRSVAQNPHHKPEGLVLSVFGTRHEEDSLKEDARRHARGIGISDLVGWEGS